MSRLDHSFIRAFEPDSRIEKNDEVASGSKSACCQRATSQVSAEVEIATESEVSCSHVQAPFFALDVGLEWDRKVSVPMAVTDESARIITDHPGVTTYPSLNGTKWPARLEVDRFTFSPACRLFMDQASAMVSIFDDARLRLGKMHQIVNVRSWTRGEGRTTISIALACNLSASGYDVVLLDGDVDNPILGQELGVSFRHGWEAYLKDELDLPEICIRSVEQGFCMIPRVKSRFNRFEQTLDERLITMLEKLSSNFDIVLIDAGPGSQIWDDLTLEMGNLIVVDDRKSASPVVAEFFEGATEGSQPILGTIHNFSKAA